MYTIEIIFSLILFCFFAWAFVYLILDIKNDKERAREYHDLINHMNKDK